MFGCTILYGPVEAGFSRNVCIVAFGMGQKDVQEKTIRKLDLLFANYTVLSGFQTQLLSFSVHGYNPQLCLEAAIVRSGQKQECYMRNKCDINSRCIALPRIYHSIQFIDILAQRKKIKINLWISTLKQCKKIRIKK